MIMDYTVELEDAEDQLWTDTAKTPLLIMDYEDSETTQERYATYSTSTTILSAVCLLIALLPMLPFWAFAGFLIFQIRYAEYLDLVSYCVILAFLIPFNLIGTVTIIGTYTRERYRRGSGGVSPGVAIGLLPAALKAPPHRILDVDDPYLDFGSSHVEACRVC